MTKTWLHILGIGENGLNDLDKSSIDLLSRSSVVFGSARQLALAKVKSKGKLWPTPFSIDEVFSYKDKLVVVLASGDPFWFGVGPLLIKNLKRNEWRSFPSRSTFSLAANKIGWALNAVDCLAFHAKPLQNLPANLSESGKAIILLKEFKQIEQVISVLRKNNVYVKEIFMLSKLGSSEEKVVKLTKSKLVDFRQASKSLKPLALGIRYKNTPSDISCFQGQDDSVFKTDGNITKKDIRALTLSQLKSFGGEVLWDVGAGSGSISIEWCLGHPQNVAFAIEKRKDRISLIKANRQKFGLEERLTIKHSNIKTMAKDLPKPNAVFIGGGATSEIIDQIIKILGKGGRLVINAVTLETEALLFRKYKQLGGNLKKINISNPKPIGGKTIWSAQYNIIQWSLKT